jgi:hypothetical protein
LRCNNESQCGVPERLALLESRKVHRIQVFPITPENEHRPRPHTRLRPYHFGDGVSFYFITLHIFTNCVKIGELPMVAVVVIGEVTADPFMLAYQPFIPGPTSHDVGKVRLAIPIERVPIIRNEERYGDGRDVPTRTHSSGMRGRIRL